MKNVTLFAATTITTVAVCTAMHLTAADAQRLASSRHPVLVNGAEVTGVLEARNDNGIYGVISITNRTDDSVSGQLNHATFCTPANSPMMRMMPRPEQKHNGTCEFDLKPGGGTQIEFCVQEPTTPKTQALATPNDGQIALPPRLPLTQPQWSLIISLGTITSPGFGGSLTMPQGRIVLPQEGQIVLAHAAANTEAHGLLEVSKQ